MESRKLRFGVNYVPSKNWAYSWVDWDSQSIKNDLQAIASLGMDHIRIHCIWSIIQPNANYVSEAVLDRLYELLEMADACELDVEITVLDGWLCGYCDYPSYLYQVPFGKKRNMFTDPEVIKAEKWVFTKIAERCGDHPRFMGFDLGNEINILLDSDMDNNCTIEEGDRWINEMFDNCEKISPDKCHVIGVDHRPWFHDVSFSRKELSQTGAATSVHTWIEFTGAREIYGNAMSTGCLHLVEYCIELAKAYNRTEDRLIWIEEFGATPEWMPESQIDAFAEKTIRNAASCGNVWGFTWWCSHEIDRKYAGFNPLEYSMGLMDIHNNVKPIGKKIKQLIKTLSDNPVEIIERSVALVLPDDLFSEQPSKPVSPDCSGSPDSPGWLLAKPFMQLIDEGIRPAIVLKSRANDKNYLESRGIKELRYLDN